ncbi:MAG: ATP-binding protein [Pleurocapsa sp.]
MWSVTAEMAERDTLLVTEETLFVLANDRQKINLDRQLEGKKFSLLLTPHFNALLQGKISPDNDKYQASITFDSQDIAAYLNQLIKTNKYNFTIIQYLQNIITNSLTKKLDNLHEFTIKAIALLTMEDENNPHFAASDNPAVEKILNYHVKKQYILDCLKIQISQQIDLWEIIQTAIERTCQFLKLDRLVIYQLDMFLENSAINYGFNDLVNAVSYEARKNEEIPSILHFKDEICFRNFSSSKNKYRQGFSLAINDVQAGSNLHPCLQSLMKKLQVRAKLVTPINVKGQLWGLAIAHQCYTPRQWHSTEIKFLRRVCEYFAIAIHQNQSYQQLQKQKKFLEKQVKTQAQQIKDALIAAQVANQSKHEFLGSMSHELRTPLTCVIGLSGTLLQWSLSTNHNSISREKQRQYLQLIQENGKHLLNLINNILEFSEIESGKYLLNIQQISLIRIAKNTLQIVKQEAKEKDINLTLELNLNLDQDLFFADEQRLTEILLNLVSNGVKFTESGGKVILRIWREKRQVVFQVEDTGIGIAEAEIPLLFEKFKQLEDFRRRTHGGAGLGLALTKQLIELHGGTIEVESEVGMGSIFTFYLPEQSVTKYPDRQQPYKVNTLEISLSEDKINLAQSNNFRWTDTKSRTIILMTEDEENATFICQLLTAIGYQVVWLTDSTMAISQIELLEPAIAIIDRDFPEILIQKITKRIKKQKKHHSIMVILLCLQLTGHDWQHFSEHGVDDYLIKSMTPNQIIDKINVLVGKNHEQESITPKDQVS